MEDKEIGKTGSLEGLSGEEKIGLLQGLDRLELDVRQELESEEETESVEAEEDLEAIRRIRRRLIRSETNPST